MLSLKSSASRAKGGAFNKTFVTSFQIFPVLERLGNLYLWKYKPHQIISLTSKQHVHFRNKPEKLLVVNYFRKKLSIRLNLSWRRPLSYKNQSTDLRSKSMNWFLYDNGLRHERVKYRFSKINFLHTSSDIKQLWNRITW